MKSRLAVILILLMLFAVIFDLGAQSGTPGKRFQGPYKGPLVRAGFITLGVAEDPPGSMWVSESELTGIGGDVWTEIARRMGLKIRAVQVTWDSLVPSVLAKKVDSEAVYMWATAARYQKVNFTIPHSYESDAIQQPKETNYGSPADLAGKTLATVTGMAQAPEYEAAGVKVKYFKLPLLAIMDVVNGGSDAAVVGAIGFGYESTMKPELKTKLKQVAVKGVSGGGGAFPIHKDNTQLLDAVNQILEDMRIDGTLSKILGKWGLSDPIFQHPPLVFPWISPEANKYVHMTYYYDEEGNINPR
ncbi:MAG: hypothetical protein A2Y38_15815 [Spirochaetes bacterium GWB1_59_5]|nr:MAG: hypothetical protein A2Y38_15815 [Spirochaetes bacterium GWB1_59_5]